MKKKKFILPVFLFILSLIFCGGITQYSTVSVKAATTTKKQTGFVMKNGSWYYYDKNGKKATGWYQSVAGNKYYFGKTGAATAGILTISGKKYCFNSKGKMLTGWQTVNRKTYFFDVKKGYMYTGWITTAAGNKYYFWNDGAVRAGFHKVNNVYYCFSEKGKMYKNCFRKNGNSTYYLQANVTMAKGRLKVKGSWYSFNRNTGQLVTSGWYKETDGSYYYAGSNGKLVNGFYKPDSYYRYFRESDCKLLTGWQTINGHKYYFKKTNGIRYDDIILKASSGKRYYFESNGKLSCSKWFTKNGSYYYSESNGVLASGWLTVSGKKYYMNPSTCERETGWISVDGEKYYLNSSTGVLATSQWIDDDNYVGENGALIPGYQNGVSFRWPLSSGYSYISSYFGYRQSPGGIGSTNHKGIDIPAPTGTPIYAAASGTIVAMLSPSASGGAGYYTKINHNNKGLITEYMHQSKFNPKLSVGDKVSKGDIIGYVGSTGNSTGPHLHFGVMVNGVNQDPLNYVKKPS